MVWHGDTLRQRYQLPLIYRWMMGVGLAASIASGTGPSAIAQSEALTRAELYSLQNQVDLLLYEQPPRPAVIADSLFPRDGVQTQDQSRAELLFNEGSLARIGANSIFRFIPGLRNYQLPDGSTRAEAILQLEQGIALVLGPAGSTTNQVQTPEAEITIAAADLPNDAPVPPTTTAVVVVHSPASGTTQIFNLTQNPTTVSLLDGSGIQTLQAGETVTASNGELGPVETFDLNRFYETSGLAVGLGPNQAGQINDESIQVQAVLNQIRTETVAAANDQARALAGFCIQDEAATSADACLTDGDDPLSTFEDERELITEPEEPDSANPDPVTPDPGTADPGTVDPGTADPGTVDPGTADPGTADPGTADPGTADPGTADPGTANPGTADPSVPIPQ